MLRKGTLALRNGLRKAGLVYKQVFEETYFKFQSDQTLNHVFSKNRLVPEKPAFLMPFLGAKVPFLSACHTLQNSLFCVHSSSR